MQIGFYFDQTRCTGCFTCAVACKDYHNIPAGPISWRSIIEIEKGKFPNVFVAYLSKSCWHCGLPSCIPACPANAITKHTEYGVVLVDQQSCLGKESCGNCLEACPYNVPQFGVEPNAKMQKCNFCIDRLAEGRNPICVDACPMRALDAGPLDHLVIKYGKLMEAEGFVNFMELAPSVIFNPKFESASCQLNVFLHS